MFISNDNSTIKTSDIIDGRLVNYVAVTDIWTLMRATWGIAIFLALHYASLILSALLNFSIFDFATRISTLEYDGSTLSQIGPILTIPLGHIGILQFFIEMTLMIALMAHTSNFIGQITVLIFAVVTPYLVLFMNSFFAAEVLGIGCISSAAALLTLSFIAKINSVYHMNRSFLIVSVVLMFVYVILSHYSFSVSIMCGIGVGLMASTLINGGTIFWSNNSQTKLTAVTYYYMPRRIAILTLPVLIVLIVSAAYIGVI